MAAVAAVVLHITIDADSLRVSFRDQSMWQPVSLLGTNGWLPPGRTVVGIMGQDRKTAIRDLSIRYLPAIEDTSL
jgi:hypothetical protein